MICSTYGSVDDFVVEFGEGLGQGAHRDDDAHGHEDL